jgi:hypothetical protein
VGKRILSIGLFLFMASSTTAFANSNCAQNNVGHIVCAPPGGSIKVKKDGVIVCGRGQCVVNKAGIILCSALPGGSAFINNMGVAVCAGVCVSASQNYCKGAR